MKSQSRALSNKQIARAALIVLGGFLASGVLGFIRQGVLAAQFGTGTAFDAFIAAQRIPEIIFVLVAGGALGSSFIPIFAKQREDSEANAWQLASAVMTFAAIAAAILGILTAIFADSIVANILLRDSSPDVQHLTANMMRLMMLTPFIFAISGLVMGILQSHGLFFLPSVAVSMNSIGIMIGALFIAPNLPQGSDVAMVGANNVYGLAYGAVLSAVLHLLIQIPGLLQVKARLRPLVNFRIRGVVDILRLMGPRVLGLAVVQVNFVVNIILADGMVEGSIAALSVAFTLMFTALGIIGQSVGSAVFPTLSALYAENDMEGFKNRLSTAMRSVLFLSFPAMVAFIVLGKPIVSIFERGEWTAESTAATAWALAFYATGIAGFALLEILSRAFYALSDTWTPVVVGMGAMLSNIALSLIFIRFIGDPDNLVRGAFAGLALANALTTLIEAAVLWWLMRRRIGTVNDKFVLDGSWRAIVASLAMGLVLWGMVQISPVQDFRLALAGGIIGGGVFFGVSIALGLDEAKAVPNMLLRRFSKRKQKHE
ncbi:MAG: murein biosynthesis integral membrane protein MurJ [Anaerolineae bacterium]|nr:murein biosynthesis integral membrane protein MurJ [Anaerolineae bacterium]MDQ7035391.1 murein biosynthesis integral membrane protein MurJ [Anaerolineae bacterium]